jgi:hypothetical protein
MNEVIRNRHHLARRGYILIATTLAIPFLLGVCGLAVDIGRMYITKNEAQAFADSASLAAARQLDGTSAGITRATAAATADSGKWRFDTEPFTTIATTFATSSAGPFTSTPPTPPTGYTFAQVLVSVNLPLYLIRLYVGDNAPVNAAAVAGQQALSSLNGGEFPFSPYIRRGYAGAVPDDAVDPFGFKVGNQYTLRWGSPGDRSDCGTDGATPSLAQNGSVRGYCCVSQSAAAIRQAIVSLATDFVTIGQPIEMESGAKNTEMTTIADRVTLDSDTGSATYTAYRAAGTGNGTRVVVVAVNGGPPNYIAKGFAAFFLLTADSYNGLKGNDSACAEYIGAWTEGETMPATGGSGAYRLRLFQ